MGCAAFWNGNYTDILQIKSYKLINISLSKTGNVFMTGTAGIFHGSIVHFEEFVRNL